MVVILRSLCCSGLSFPSQNVPAAKKPTTTVANSDSYFSTYFSQYLTRSHIYRLRAVNFQFCRVIFRGQICLLFPLLQGIAALRYVYICCLLRAFFVSYISNWIKECELRLFRHEASKTLPAVKWHIRVFHCFMSVFEAYTACPLNLWRNWFSVF